LIEEEVTIGLGARREPEAETTTIDARIIGIGIAGRIGPGIGGMTGPEIVVETMPLTGVLHGGRTTGVTTEKRIEAVLRF